MTVPTKHLGTGPTYAEVGATEHPTMPSGYRHLDHRTLLGSGTELQRRAGEALLTWQVHHASGLRVLTSGPRAAPGVTMVSTLGLGRLGLPAPCRVVWVQETSHLIGFAYGTLPGHPFRGEESFTVERDDEDRVWFRVRAFSVPDQWYVRVAGPLPRVGQRLFARRYAAVLRRLVVPGT